MSEQGDCLSKYQRGLIQDDIHSLVSERQINAQSAQQAERFAPHDQHAELRSHQLAPDNVSNSCQSSLLSNSTEHNRVDAFQSNRIASPSANSYQGAEFKQENQVTVSCDASNSNNLHETMSASQPLAHSSVELRATKSLNFVKGKNGSQHLKEQLDDFERILKNYQNSEGTKRTNNGQSSGLESQQQQQKQLQTTQLKQSDPMSRSSTQEQVNDRNAHVSVNSSLQNVPYRQSGSLHLQEMARQSAHLAQANQVRTQQRITESQQQRLGFNHNIQQQLQLERIKQASQSVQQQQNSVSQTQQTAGNVSSYFHSPFSQNQYRPGFEDQSQNADVTRVSTGYSAVHYQRTLQAMQNGQQGMYGFSGQQAMQKLTHTMQEKSQMYAQQHNNRQLMLQQQQGQLAGFEAVPQARQLSLQELPSMPYSVGMQLANQSSPVYQRQHSMPHMASNTYQQQSFYNSQSSTFKTKEQTAPAIQQSDQQVPTYNSHQQRRHSFPFNRSLNQPTDNFLPNMQDAYSMVNHINPQSRGTAFVQQNVLDIRHNVPQSSVGTQNKLGSRQVHSPVSYSTNIAGRSLLQSTPNQTASKNHCKLSQMSSSQVNHNFPINNSNDFNRIQRDNSFSSYQTSEAPVTSSSSQFAPFSSTPTLEKAPSFTSLLSQASVGELGPLFDQASNNSSNLETTFSGSIPNLDLLDGILGQT